MHGEGCVTTLLGYENTGAVVLHSRICVTKVTVCTGRAVICPRARSKQERDTMNSVTKAGILQGKMRRFVFCTRGLGDGGSGGWGEWGMGGGRMGGRGDKGRGQGRLSASPIEIYFMNFMSEII